MSMAYIHVERTDMTVSISDPGSANAVENGTKKIIPHM